MHHPPEILLFFGRFHVLLVHLPIGMLLLLAILEIAARFNRFKTANASAGFILAVAAPLAVVTAVCGWLLSLGGGYAENLLEWHERFGIATAAGSVLAAIFFWRKKAGVYRVVLFATVAVMMVAGHLGGSLTHGSDYLTRYAPAFLKSLLGGAAAPAQNPPAAGKNVESQAVFSGVVAPVIQARCESCHGATKAKGGLRLDSFAAVKAGGDDGPILDATTPAESELLRRIQLPLDDDDHMPPSGKPQLTTNELALLKWWVQAGAPETNTLAQLQAPPAILNLLAAEPRAK